MVAKSSIEESLEAEEYNVNELEKMNRLGKGGFCNVHLVNTRRDGVLRRVAMKELHLEGIDTQHEFHEAAKDLIQEAQILQQVHHSNIVGLRGISDLDPNSFLSSLGNSGTYFILLDVMLETLEERLNRWYKDDKSWKTKPSTLLAFRKAMLRRMPKEVCRKRMMERIRTVVMDVAGAMEYLHEHNIIFQDLKPENIGFEIETDQLKIFDFGMARSVHPVTGKIVGEEEEMICGTPRYFAPEIFDFSGGSKQTDVYAFGIMLHEICSMNVPFGKMDDFEAFRDHICAGGRPNMLEIPDDATRQVIEDCTLEDPAARPSFSDLRACRLPELLVEKKELETSVRTPETEISEMQSGLCVNVIPLDLGDNDTIEKCQLPQEFDDVPSRSYASNQSMPRMRHHGDEESVNSRDLGRSTHSASSDFLSNSECGMLPDDGDGSCLTDEQKQRRKERIQRILARKNKPRRRRLKNEDPKEHHSGGKVLLRRSSLCDDHDVPLRESPSDPVGLDSHSSIPRNLSYTDDNDAGSFADDAISLNGDSPSVNDYTISLKGERSVTSRVSDDGLEMTQDVQHVIEEIPLEEVPRPPPPPPPLPMQSPRAGLDNSSHGARKKRRKKKKGMDLSSHSALNIATVPLADEGPEDQPPPPPPPHPPQSPQLSVGTMKSRKKKEKTGMDLSSHSTFTSATVFQADDEPAASSGVNDEALDSTEDQPPPPPPPPQSAQLSTGTMKSRKKKKKTGMDLSNHSVLSASKKKKNSGMDRSSHSALSASKSAPDLKSAKCVSDDDASQAGRRKKKRGGKKKDFMFSLENKSHANKMSPSSPTVGSPKSSSKSPKSSRTRKKNKLEMKLEPQLSQRALADPAKEDPVPFLRSTSDAMLRKSERPTMPSREFSWWTLKNAQ
ncbi:unnamed protein product [Cylindrotheca closterium]|uniref:Protein kinase domain-containing protein n=1 Tax=Cylindrotheca closterium TaxID=2856 RepID=A0AAD2CF17_9STRA|nr:unnamed protein product [Cylindrotheca closterium]